MKKAYEYDLNNPEIMEYPYDFYEAIRLCGPPRSKEKLVEEQN